MAERSSYTRLVGGSNPSERKNRELCYNKNIGPKVIGIDFAPHMIERAKQVIKEAGLSRRAEFILLDKE